MLAGSCRRFREEYDRGAQDPHRDRCRRCAEWADWMDRLPSVGARFEAPPRLVAGLAEMAAASSLTCHDVDGLWLDGELDRLPEDQAPTVAEAVARHRGGCRRCRALHRGLDAHRDALLPLPSALRQRLCEVVLRGACRVPMAIVGWRRAAMASYLLASSLVLMPGDPLPRARQAVVELRYQANGTVLEWEARGEELVTTLSSRAREELRRRATRLDSWRADLSLQWETLRNRIPSAQKPEGGKPPSNADVRKE